MSEQLYVKVKIINVPWSVTEITNPLIDDSASHGDQTEEYVPHPNNNEYYEESDIEEDKDHYDNNDDDDIPPILKELRIDFKARQAENVRRMREVKNILMEEGQADIRRSLDIGIKSLQTHFVRSIDYDIKSVKEDRESDKVQQVGLY